MRRLVCALFVALSVVATAQVSVGRRTSSVFVLPIGKTVPGDQIESSSPSAQPPTDEVKANGLFFPAVQYQLTLIIETGFGPVATAEAFWFTIDRSAPPRPWSTFVQPEDK